MKFLFMFVMASAFAQSPKSIELPRVEAQTERQKQEAELIEDKKARLNWDREEAAAQAQEERRRLIDEEREKTGP